MRLLTEIGKLPQASALLTSDGRLLAPIFEQNRISIPIEHVAEPVLRCLVATEDRRFFIHGGVDLRAILRAAYVNFRERKIVQGGSTITQQLARMATLKRSDRSLRRKLAEICVALLIERQMTKRQIIHHYLNSAYFGHGIFGIEQAALAFCGKRAIELDYSDAAYLVALLKAPARYCRCCNPARAEQRTSIVVRLSGAAGGFRPTPTVRWQPRESFSTHAPLTASYAIELVRKCLLQLVPQYYPQHRLKIRTTIDPICQSVLESVCVSVRQLGYAGRLACIIQDARSGSIKAITGGTAFPEQRFNSAADGLLQPGSLLKPFIFLAAIRAGLTLDHKFLSCPLSIKMPDGRIWSVRNAGERYTGVTTIADATVHSDNSVYAQLLQEIGLDKVKRILTQVGMPARNATLAISTGALRPGVSPLTMCSAYSVFSAAGFFFSPSVISRITGEDGRILYENVQTGIPICTPAEALKITSVLQRVATEGTGKLPIPHSGLAAKTGTSMSGGWYASFDGTYRVLTWTESDFSPLSSKYYSGKAVSARELASRVWHLLTKAQVGFQELFAVFAGVDKMSVRDLLWVEEHFEAT